MNAKYTTIAKTKKVFFTFYLISKKEEEEDT